MVTDYELTLILNPEVSEDKFKATLDKVSQLITGKGGAISAVEPWGKKRMAFPIKRFREGNYVLLKCTMDPKIITELESSLKLTEEVLRHLLIKVEK